METILIKNDHNKAYIGTCRNCGSIFKAFKNELTEYCDHQGSGVSDSRCSHCEKYSVKWNVEVKVCLPGHRGLSFEDQVKLGNLKWAGD